MRRGDFIEEYRAHENLFSDVSRILASIAFLLQNALHGLPSNKQSERSYIQVNLATEWRFQSDWLPKKDLIFHTDQVLARLLFLIKGNPGTEFLPNDRVSYIKILYNNLVRSELEASSFHISNKGATFEFIEKFGIRDADLSFQVLSFLEESPLERAQEGFIAIMRGSSFSQKFSTPDGSGVYDYPEYFSWHRAPQIPATRVIAVIDLVSTPF